MTKCNVDTLRSSAAKSAGCVRPADDGCRAVITFHVPEAGTASVRNAGNATALEVSGRATRRTSESWGGNQWRGRGRLSRKNLESVTSSLPENVSERHRWRRGISLTLQSNAARSCAQRVARNAVSKESSTPIIQITPGHCSWNGFAPSVMELNIAPRRPWVWVVEFKRVSP